MAVLGAFFWSWISDYELHNMKLGSGQHFGCSRRTTSVALHCSVSVNESAWSADRSFSLNSVFVILHTLSRCLQFAVLAHPSVQMTGPVEHHRFAIGHQALRLQTLLVHSWKLIGKKLIVSLGFQQIESCFEVQLSWINLHRTNSKLNESDATYRWSNSCFWFAISGIYSSDRLPIPRATGSGHAAAPRCCTCRRSRCPPWIEPSFRSALSRSRSRVQLWKRNGLVSFSHCASWRFRHWVQTQDPGPGMILMSNWRFEA